VDPLEEFRTDFPRDAPDLDCELDRALEFGAFRSTNWTPSLVEISSADEL